MKVAQNDETNANTQSVRPPDVPSIANLQLSSSVSSVRKMQTSGKLSRMFPPFAESTYYRVRAHLAPRIVMSRFVIDCFVIYCVPPPLLLSGRPRD